MRLRQMWAALFALAFLASGPLVSAQTPKVRLSAAIDNSKRVRWTDLHPEYAHKGAVSGTDTGALPAGFALHGVTLVFNRSAAQQADLDTLLAAQQNAQSPLFHRWLTPDQFAARFGMADADLKQAEAWLRSQGFEVMGVSRGRDRITFNGTAGQIAAAFGTELHSYHSDTGTHFAPTGDLSLPTALAPLVSGLLRLSDFHAHRQSKVIPVKPSYTSAQTGSHFLTPADVATMYDMNSTYQAGFNGTGQAIAIVGQSFIETSSISAFQRGAGLSVNAPNLVLVPNTGVNGIDPNSDGDEGESQLDVEYASGMAPGATIYFVYTGDDPNAGVFDSLSYAIQENVAPVISVSYGACEPVLQASGTSAVQYANMLSAEIQQANTQGQTVLSASGDAGSTSCYGYTNLGTATEQGLAVTFPASIPAVTALGGTQMAAGTFASTSTQYWQSATGSDAISSLLSYVPETVWNEDTVAPLASGGGGTSVLFARPSWQTGVPGIPTGTNRLLPDISLQASIESPGFIYCTSDAADLNASSLAASCSSGLRSSSGTFLIAGGTSFSTPIFAGMLAVLNQVTHATGQGNINPILYGLAANASTYSSAFHDITSGSNACTAGATYCSAVGAGSYAATAGFDEASGLGSIDFAKLVAAWPASVAASSVGTYTVITPATTTPGAGTTDLLSISVTPQAQAGTPTGTVQIVVNGTAVTPTLPLVNGVTAYTFTAPTATGSYVVNAIYSGDATYAASSSSAVLNVGSATPAGTFTITAPALTVPYNSIASSTVTLTPASGYTGTVALALSTSDTSLTLCYAVSNTLAGGSNVPMVNNGQPVPVTLTLGEGTACTSSASATFIGGGKAGAQMAKGSAPQPVRRRWPEGIAFAALLFAGLGFRRTKRLPSLLSVAILAVLGFGLTGCGGNNGTSTTVPIKTQPVTIAVTLTGTDTVNTSISSTATFNLTVQQQ